MNNSNNLGTRVVLIPISVKAYGVFVVRKVYKRFSGMYNTPVQVCYAAWKTLTTTYMQHNTIFQNSLQTLTIIIHPLLTQVVAKLPHQCIQMVSVVLSDTNASNDKPV